MNPNASESTKVFNPWNPKNREVTPSDVIPILRKYGWKGRFNNFKLFAQACCHKSYVDRPELWQEQAENGEEVIIAPRPDDCIPLRTSDNEELEYLGDRVLGLVIASYVTKRYPGQGEGFLTRILSRIVNNKQLGKLAKDVGMGQFIILSRHMEEVCDGRNNLRILGSMFEAWFGALYLQEEDLGRGLQQCNDFLVRIIERHIDFVQIIIEDTNYKDQLLRKFQAMYHVPPRYKEIAVVGPPHDRIFTMGVLDPMDRILTTATARNKKVAEQEASRAALELLDPLSEGQNILPRFQRSMDPLSEGQNILPRFQRSMDPLSEGQNILPRFQRSMDPLSEGQNILPRFQRSMDPLSEGQHMLPRFQRSADSQQVDSPSDAKKGKQKK